MIPLNKDFKSQIKSILLENYNINCRKISDSTNYAGGSQILIFSLHCMIGFSKSTLYLHINKPSESIDLQELYFEIFAQGISIHHIKNIQKKVYPDDLNKSLENLKETFKELGHHVDFTIADPTSLSLLRGNCHFISNKFKIKNYNSLIKTESKIYTSSLALHNQVKICKFIIDENTVKLWNTLSPLNFLYDINEADKDSELFYYLFKLYITLLKFKSRCLEDISFESIEKASFDDLKKYNYAF